MLGEHDFMDKRWMYEESIKMPFFVRFPKSIKSGSRTDAIINNTDFAPTIISLTGGKSPKYIQGNSFKTILESIIFYMALSWELYIFQHFLILF